MFNNTIMSVGGNLPNEVFQKITKFSRQFYKVLEKLVHNGYYDRKIIRLLKPTKVCVLLDDTFIHFVLSNKSIGGVISVNHADFRGNGTASLRQAFEIVERDLAYEDCFGFSVPAIILSKDEFTEEEVLPHVEQYCKSEAIFHERLMKIVRINPVFKGREFLVDDSSCFVLMPFCNEHHLQEIYTDQIKPIVTSLGLSCLRADDIYSNTPIVETIWENINKAKIILAELTGKNPNVFYELGIAHTVGKEVILLSQNIEDVPFDLRHLRVILYDVTPRGVNNLEKQLTATITAIRSKQS